ncbi:MAG: hypothetical protein QOE58_1889, partial [Actinomycetota bacterium]|nr:hypothetical protein [Actinomycetota bacterium]
VVESPHSDEYSWFTASRSAEIIPRLRHPSVGLWAHGWAQLRAGVAILIATDRTNAVTDHAPVQAKVAPVTHA